MSDTSPTVERSKALVKHTGPSKSDELLSQFEERLSHLREALTDFNERAVVFIRERPVVSVVGAVAIGYVVGRSAARRWLR